MIPSPDNLPVNWLWFQILLILTFVIHMILVNLLLGGSLLAIWDRITKSEKALFSKKLPIMAALSINWGIPPLLFIQVLYGHFFYTSSVLIAVYWILVIPILLLAYYGMYIYVKKSEKAPFWATFSLCASALFLLYIAFMFVTNSTLAQQPDEWVAYFQNSHGTLLHLGEPTLWPRFLHFIFASVAIAAIGRSLFVQYAKKMTPEKKRMAVHNNLKITAGATFFQLFVGIWFWLSMPDSVGKIFMGGQFTPTLLMVFGWIFAAAILYLTFHTLLSIIFMIFQNLFRDHYGEVKAIGSIPRAVRYSSCTGLKGRAKRRWFSTLRTSILKNLVVSINEVGRVVGLSFQPVMAMPVSAI